MPQGPLANRGSLQPAAQTSLASFACREFEQADELRLGDELVLSFSRWFIHVSSLPLLPELSFR
jgi:hypothetical protein